MRKNCTVVDPTEPLRAAFNKMRRVECSILPVLEDGGLVRSLTLENIGDLVIASEAVGEFGWRA